MARERAQKKPPPEIKTSQLRNLSYFESLKPTRALAPPDQVEQIALRSAPQPPRRESKGRANVRLRRNPLKGSAKSKTQKDHVPAQV